MRYHSLINKLKLTQFIIGYDKNIFNPIIVDMLITPHLLVCGLPGSGKTKLVEYSMKNKNVILINAFDNDFESLKARRIIGNDNILLFLNNMLIEPYKRSEPLYLVVDELMILCMDNKIEKAIMQLMAIARHLNVYLIGICQLGNKDLVKFKELFNTRVCLRQVEESSYRVVLGYSPEEKLLKKREFYYYSDNVGKGYTYDI